MGCEVAEAGADEGAVWVAGTGKEGKDDTAGAPLAQALNCGGGAGRNTTLPGAA